MSMKTDIAYTLSQDYIKSKLTIEERARLLVEITEDLQWDSYPTEKENGEWSIDFGIPKAIEDLKFIENMKKK